MCEHQRIDRPMICSCCEALSAGSTMCMLLMLMSDIPSLLHERSALITAP